MPIVATPARRRLVMAVLLALAGAGGVIRWQAPDPSTARDVGTLLLVLWLPAVGNLVAYLRGKLPKAAPPPTHFAPGAPFSPHLEVTLQPLALADGACPGLLPGQLATVVVGRRGFTARLAEPVAPWAAGDGAVVRELELLRPSAALGRLRAGTAFHLLVGPQPVARGRIVRCMGALLR